MRGRIRNHHYHLASKNTLQLQFVIRVGSTYRELVGVGQSKNLQISRQHHFCQVVFHRLLQYRVQGSQYRLRIIHETSNHFHLTNLLLAGDTLLDLPMIHTTRRHHGVLQRTSDHRVDDGLRKPFYALLRLYITMITTLDKTRHSDHIGSQPLGCLLVVVYFQFLVVMSGIDIEP